MQRIVGCKVGSGSAAHALDLLCHYCAEVNLSSLVEQNTAEHVFREAGQVQALFLRVITATRRSTPCAAMRIMLNLPSLVLHSKPEAMNTAYRLGCVGMWKTDSKRHKRLFWVTLIEIWK